MSSLGAPEIRYLKAKVFSQDSNSAFLKSQKYQRQPTWRICSCFLSTSFFKISFCFLTTAVNST